MSNFIPVIDIFAGPGGLGEGFSALESQDGKPLFKIKLSIEMDEFAHKTLELRAFYRQFPKKEVPFDYYECLRGNLEREELFRRHPHESAEAKKEAWMATLGKTNREIVRNRIEEALDGATDWLLIGGPPCQAYSLIGRSKLRSQSKWHYARDHRHLLYKQYLKILADHQPTAFVMENVKGLLSSKRTKTQQKNTFELIISDLQRPEANLKNTGERLAYKLFSFSNQLSNGSDELDPKDFVVRSEEYGIPQARHRLIIFGIRADVFKSPPGTLDEVEQVCIEDVISDLPELRSGLSKEPDAPDAWSDAVKSIVQAAWMNSVSPKLRQAIVRSAEKIKSDLTRGQSFLPRIISTRRYQHWYIDDALTGVCNHETRQHVRGDLHRYFFAAVYANLESRSPTLRDFPKELLPQHANVQNATDDIIFNDRFRVQIRGKPSTTIVSHISKDGHYYIHYDPLQCRSLTVREAARLQTFPDNYFFVGNRTEQYHQVGNAVPPLLAKKIAEIVAKLFVSR